MAKKLTEQPRLPKDLMDTIRAIAPALGESANEWLTRVAREALKKDIPRAAKALADRAKYAAGKEETE